MIKKLFLVLMVLGLICGFVSGPGMAADDLKFQDSDLAKIYYFDQWGSSFQLPSTKWSFIGEQENEQLRAAMFSFRREAIVDKSKTPVMANVTFIFEKVPLNTNLDNYSARSLKRAPLIIKNKFTAKEGPITIKNAVGYMGTYRSPDGIDHSLILVHAISAGKGMQIMMDITSELAPKVIKEFYTILNTLKFK